MNNVLTSRVVVANVMLAVWLLADAVRAFIVMPIDALDLVEIIGALAFISAAMFVLLRPAPVAQDLRASTIAVALGAAFVPIALQSLSTASTRGRAFFIFVEASAVVVLTLSILHLGRRFSLVPQYRSLVSTGPYAIVRHPMYGCYLLFDGALALESASWASAGLWLVEAALLSLRAQREEELLQTHEPTYAAYVALVRYRFVPFVV